MEQEKLAGKAKDAQKLFKTVYLENQQGTQCAVFYSGKIRRYGV